MLSVSEDQGRKIMGWGGRISHVDKRANVPRADLDRIPRSEWQSLLINAIIYTELRVREWQATIPVLLEAKVAL